MLIKIGPYHPDQIPKDSIEILWYKYVSVVRNVSIWTQVFLDYLASS